jgi:hypothetical protein
LLVIRYVVQNTAFFRQWLSKHQLNVISCLAVEGNHRKIRIQKKVEISGAVLNSPQLIERVLKFQLLGFFSVISRKNTFRPSSEGYTDASNQQL